MDKFFPTSGRNVKRLLRIVDMSCNPDQLRDQMCRHLRERIESIERELPKTAKEYVNLRTQCAENADRVKTRRAANGVPLSKEQYTAAVAAGQSLRSHIHDMDMQIKRAQRMIPSLQKNLEVIEDA